MRSSAAPGENGENSGSAASNAYSKEYIYSRGGANGANGTGSSAISSSSSNGTKRRSNAPPSLDHVLPENSMRYRLCV